jgi:hypothetical protein
MKRSHHIFWHEMLLWHGIGQGLDSPQSGRHQRKSHKIKAGRKLIFSPRFFRQSD